MAEPATGSHLVTARRVLDGPAGRAARALRRAPVSLVLLAALWLLGILTGALRHGPSPDLARWVSSGVASFESGHVWVLWTSGLFASGIVEYLLVTVVIAGSSPATAQTGSGTIEAASPCTSGSPVPAGLPYTTRLRASASFV